MKPKVKTFTLHLGTKKVPVKINYSHSGISEILFNPKRLTLPEQFLLWKDIYGRQK